MEINQTNSGAATYAMKKALEMPKGLLKLPLTYAPLVRGNSTTKRAPFGWLSLTLI